MVPPSPLALGVWRRMPSITSSASTSSTTPRKVRIWLKPLNYTILVLTYIQSCSSISAELEQAGVRVLAFPVERTTIDHVKLLIVDGVRAIVGGINWGTHSPLNHDFDVLATGPVVANLERVFQQDLALAGEPALIAAPSLDRRVQVLVTRPGDGIRSAAVSAVAAARHTI